MPQQCEYKVLMVGVSGRGRRNCRNAATVKEHGVWLCTKHSSAGQTANEARKVANEEKRKRQWQIKFELANLKNKDK